MTPEAFVNDFLAVQMKAKVVCCGSDFRFGKGAAAGVEELKQLCLPVGIKVCEVPAVLVDGSPVSSTRIRAAVAAGKMEEAARLLGRRYSFGTAVGLMKSLIGLTLMVSMNEFCKKFANRRIF